MNTGFSGAGTSCLRLFAISNHLCIYRKKHILYEYAVWVFAWLFLLFRREVSVHLKLNPRGKPGGY
jgi:1-acyl-sn-glycerol-3-phosphate acyltransferase